MDIIEHHRCSELGINADKIKLPKFNIIEKHTLTTYMEITRHFQEIYQLFNIYQYNLENIFNSYNINANVLTRKYKFNSNQNDDIIINSLIISYISSGKTLADSINTFMNLHLKLSSEPQTPSTKNFISEIYDENFYYRFFNHLRHFAQHGHLPVSVNDINNHCCFNLQHFLYTPHYKHNATLKTEIQEAVEDIKENYPVDPNIDFCLSIAEFNLCIIKIYDWFLNSIEELIKSHRNQIDLLLKKRKNIIYKSKDIFNGFVFYDYYNDSLHCFNPKENPVEMLLEIKNEVADVLKTSQTYLEGITNNPNHKIIYYEKA